MRRIKLTVNVFSKGWYLNQFYVLYLPQQIGDFVRNRPGNTGVAAVRLGRRFIGIEQMAEHCAAARLRIEAETAGSDSRSVRAGQLAMFGGG